MFAPVGYVRFDEIWAVSREIARDISWSYNSRKIEKDGEETITINSDPAERYILETWLLTSFLWWQETCVCSPDGVILRAPRCLFRHIDQLEMLPCPVPIKESSLLNLYDEIKGITDLHKPRDKFMFIDALTGVVEVSTQSKKNCPS